MRESLNAIQRKGQDPLKETGEHHQRHWGVARMVSLSNKESDMTRDHTHAVGRFDWMALGDGWRKLLCMLVLSRFSCVWLCDLVNCKISEPPIKMVNVQSFWVWEWNSQICELLRLLVPIRWIIVERLGSMRKQS